MKGCCHFNTECTDSIYCYTHFFFLNCLKQSRLYLQWYCDIILNLAVQAQKNRWKRTQFSIYALYESPFWWVHEWRIANWCVYRVLMKHAVCKHDSHVCCWCPPGAVWWPQPVCQTLSEQHAVHDPPASERRRHCISNICI